MTAARQSSLPAAAPHLTCNLSAPEHTGLALVHASTRRVAPEPASSPSAMAEEKGSYHLPKTRRRGRGAVDFCPHVWGRNGLGACLNLRDVCVGVVFYVVHKEKEKKQVQRAKMLKAVEGHRLGKCTVHNKAPGPAVLLGQSLR